MSEINSIANGTYVIGQTSATNFIGGPGIKVDSPSAGTVRIGNDETVLWSGNLTSAQSATLSESYKNFEKVEFTWVDWDSQQTYHVDDFSTKSPIVSMCGSWYGSPNSILLFRVNGRFVDTGTFTIDNALFISTTATAYNNAGNTKIVKIAGINRISGGNE